MGGIMQPSPLRRWYVYLAAVAMAICGVVAFYDAPRIFTGQAEVSFEPPPAVTRSSTWRDYTESLVFFSEVVNMTYAESHPSVVLSTPQATLFGNGVREGIAVRLQARGNQWVQQLDRPVITISVSTANSQDVRARLETAARQVADTANRVQQDAGVPSDLRIVAEWDPEEFAFGSFARSRRSTLSGAVMLVVSCSIIARLVATQLDRAASRRERNHRPGAGDRPHPTGSAAPASTPPLSVSRTGA